jgi:ClpP class serine protease
MTDRKAHAIAPEAIAAMFAGERLAIAREWEDRFAEGALPTKLDRRAGMFDDDSSSGPSSSFERVGAVNVVTIDGPLLQHGGGWWFDGHEAIRARIADAVAAGPKIIALRIDSPGGVVAGCYDMVRSAAEIIAAAGIMCVAWCGGSGAFSGGYAWASVASEISVPDSGGVGSIGVMSKIRDWTKANEIEGIKVDVIRSGDRKCEKDPDIKTTPAAVAREQAIVDDMAAIFAAIVNNTRKLGTEKILGYQGECFFGAKAVEVGLADCVESFDAFMARCQARAEEMSMKATALRLGLAADASEADIMKAIDALEQRAVKAEGEARKAAEECDRVAGTLISAVKAEALVSGRKTAGQIAADEEIFAEMPKARAAVKIHEAYAKIERGAALPKETKEPIDPPQTKGPSVVATEANVAALNGAAMTVTQIAAHYGTAHYERLMNEHVTAQASKDAGMFARVQPPNGAPRLNA